MYDLLLIALNLNLIVMIPLRVRDAEILETVCLITGEGLLGIYTAYTHAISKFPRWFLVMRPIINTFMFSMFILAAILCDLPMYISLLTLSLAAIAQSAHELLTTSDTVEYIYQSKIKVKPNIQTRVVLVQENV